MIVLSYIIALSEWKQQTHETIQTTKLGRTEWKIHGLRSLHRDILLLSLSMLAIVMVKSFSVLRPTRAESFALLHTAAADTDGLHCT